MLKSLAVLAFTVACVPFQRPCAQKLNLENYSFGCRVFETNSFGNSPLTVAEFLKEPAAYQNFINTINYNSLTGNPGIQVLRTFYFLTEWRRDVPDSRFWRKHRLQAGLLLTQRSKTPAGSLANERFESTPVTTKLDDRYVLQRVRQFAGVQLGLTRVFQWGRRIRFTTGLLGQASLAVVHHYKHRWDSSRFTLQDGWQRKSTALPDVKGRNYPQWQAMVPLALAYNIRHGISLRFELLAGIVGGQYFPRNFASREAHGAGLFLMYTPRKQRQPVRSRS